ncbi:MAG: hypothetical protein AAF725_11435 [Acidobacteriota bacterium]
MTEPPPIPKPPPPPPPATDLRTKSFEEEYGEPSSSRPDGVQEALEDAILYDGPAVADSAFRRGYGCFSGLVLGFLVACAATVVILITGADTSILKFFAILTLGGGLLGLARPESTSFSGIIGSAWDDFFG